MNKVVIKMQKLDIIFITIFLVTFVKDKFIRIIMINTLDYTIFFCKTYT